MHRAPFDEGDAKRLAEYVRERYRDTRRVRRIAWTIYSEALPSFEREQMGLCASVTASHGDIAQRCECYPGTVGPSLRALRAVGLIEYEVGERGPGSKAASVIRRRTHDEILNGRPENLIAPPIWPKAAMLAETLSRPISFDGKPISPRWDAQNTGRVYSKIQNHPAKQRARALLSGIPAGHLLVTFDLSQAEPSVIRALLHQYGMAPASWPDDDPYQFLASTMGIPRDEAKRSLNSKAYCRNPVQAAKAEYSPYGTAARWAIEYAEAVDKLRRLLRIEAKNRTPPFSVLTLAGRIIHSLGGNKKRRKWPHNGQLLSWVAQGSVADAVVPACLEIISREPETGWRLLVNLHDGFALDVPCEDQANEAEAVLRKHLERAGLSFLKIKRDTHHHDHTTTHV